LTNISNIKKLDDACKILFGPDFQFSSDTLDYIQESGIKSAYRNVVKKCHPDKAGLFGKNENELSSRFKKVNDAYNILLDTIKNKSKKIKYDSRVGDFYYVGSMPKRSLRFGEFLYYKKIISWNSLIKALTWQYRQRPKIGQICKDHNFIKDEDILKIIKDIRPNERFGEAAVRNKFINYKQLEKMLKEQNDFNFPLGRYFVSNNILSSDYIEQLAKEHKIYNLTFLNNNYPFTSSTQSRV
jgi:curved DNA-binding protein CbpA